MTGFVFICCLITMASFVDATEALVIFKAKIKYLEKYLERFFFPLLTKIPFSQKKREKTSVAEAAC